jgi:hypothetical protein
MEMRNNNRMGARGEVACWNDAIGRWLASYRARRTVLCGCDAATLVQATVARVSIRPARHVRPLSPWLRRESGEATAKLLGLADEVIE